jgi:hypothetical protein
MSKPNEMQGEGNKEAAKNYNEAQQEFVKSGRVDQAAEDAKPKSKEEAEELEHAEAEGLSRAKEEDPAVHRDRKRVGVDRGSKPKDEDLDIE